MKNKPLELHHFTADEIFMMIEGYATGLLNHIREEEPVPNEVIMETSRRIIEILKETQVEGRVGIVILLNAACALYEVGTEMPSCPPNRLN